MTIVFRRSGHAYLLTYLYENDVHLVLFMNVYRNAVLCSICIAGNMHKHAKMPVYEETSCLENAALL